MTRTLRVLALPALVFALAPVLHTAASAEDLLREAFLMEFRNRDPQMALAMYRTIANAPGSGAMIQFEARLRMGRCLERLGKRKEASEIYEAILKDTAAPPSELSQEVRMDLMRVKGQKSSLWRGPRQGPSFWVS